ncbi:hypothetical protein M8C21_008545, partial [Ambrosia artemisiifolia]
VTSVKELSGQICQICGDEIEITADDLVMNMKEERVTKFSLNARLGGPRVDGDEDEEEFDDLDNEFDVANFLRRDGHVVSEAGLSSRFNIRLVYRPPLPRWMVP